MNPITEHEKQELFTALWGGAPRNTVDPLANAYLRHYDKLRNRSKLNHQQMAKLIETLRLNPDTKLSELLQDRQGGESKSTTATTECAKSFALAASLMLGLNLGAIRDSESGMGHPPEDLKDSETAKEGRPEDLQEIGDSRAAKDWQLDKSLRGIKDELFPTENRADINQPINRSQLRAFNLRDYAGVTLYWTTDLSDHLQLRTNFSSRDKQLRIFQHPSLLLSAYQVRVDEEAKNNDNNDNNKNKKNTTPVYNTPFLLETLMTYRLLFPEQDHLRLLGLLSRTGKDLHIALDALSPELKQRDWEQKQREWEQQIRSTAQLAEQYPHWGERLQLIYEEANNPTPVSRLSQWAERYRLPRYTYLATVIGFAIALVFGIVSTWLAAIQIWIAYSAERKGAPGNRTG